MGKVTVSFNDLVSVKNGKSLCIANKKHLESGKPFPLVYLVNDNGELRKATNDRSLKNVLGVKSDLHWFNLTEGDEVSPMSEEDRKVLRLYLDTNGMKAETTDEYISIDG